MSDDVIAALRDAIGAGEVLTGPDVAARDPGWGHTEAPVARAVVRPRDTDQVAAVLRICHHAGQPVVVQGGLTGVVDGAVTGQHEIALTLERMTDIQEVDVVGRTMTVQAGVRLQTIQERAGAAGLMFPLDLGARGSATIGGNASTNAGGNNVIRFGMARENILGLEAVLADGTIVPALNRMIKNNAAYDLKHLFIGSEGTLGIVTRLVLRLRPAPRSRSTALVSAPDFEKVTALLGAVDRGLGGSLSAFEVLWSDFYELVTTPPARGAPILPHGSPFYVLLEALGSDEEADGDRFERVLQGCAADGSITDATLARSASERRAMWSLRDDVDQLFRLGPIFLFDVSLPIREMRGYTVEVRAGLEKAWPGSRCIIFGHLGDGNLHLAAAVGEGNPETRRRVEEIIYGPLRTRAGSVSAEHGIGLEKLPYLSWCRSRAEIDLMRTLKRTLDPRNILNPGRVLPPGG